MSDDPVGAEPLTRARACLRHRFPHAADLEVVELERYPAGVSRETWFARLRTSADGVPPGVVIRRNLRGGSVDATPLRCEFETYRRPAPSSVPVARVLWYEDEPERWLPGPEFYVRELVEGAWEIPHLDDPDPLYDDLRIELSKEHLRASHPSTRATGRHSVSRRSSINRQHRVTRAANEREHRSADYSAFSWVNSPRLGWVATEILDFARFGLAAAAGIVAGTSAS